MKVVEAPESARRVLGGLHRDDATVAFLEHAGFVWFARVRRGAPSWRSPVLDLVQGVYWLVGRGAHRVLRNRIFVDSAECVLARSVVQVAARRMTSDVQPLSGPRPARTIDVGPAAAVARRCARESFDSTHDLPQIDGDAQIMEVARQAASVRRAGAPRWAQHRLVGAALAHGEVVLGVAGNRNAVRRCEHAELRLVQGWTERTGRPLPDGARVAVTLQCCRMCAAALVHAACGRLDVLYAEPDPGRLAQHTALQQRGWERLLCTE